MGRLILVSNRLPLQIRRVGRRQEIVPSAGGLVAGLGPIHEAGDSLWIGSLGSSARAPLLRELEKRRLISVPLDKDTAERAYEGFSNQTVWPLFHYLLGEVRFDRTDYEAYHEVNECFADAVSELARPGDRIWVHDYHLMLLPKMLRDRLPSACIGFFLHIPFPSSEVFRILPRKERILSGLLGADLVGLHTYDYARHLVSSFRRVLAVEFDARWVSQTAETCRVGVFPLGVNARELRERAAGEAAQKFRDRLARGVQGRKVILGVDRMDYTKGLPLRLAAIRRLFELAPEWRDRALFMQLVVPSRANIPEYRSLKQEVDRLVGEINGRFSRDGVTPVQYMNRAVPKDELLAMFLIADVALVTPVRDGMNLVAKEYVASRLDNSGVLVLSEFAGAASEMGEALLQNPWDIDATAETIRRALSMSRAEMERRMRALRHRMEVNDLEGWFHRFLNALDLAHRIRFPQQPEGLTWQEPCAKAFAACQRALLLLDYDGTIADIAQSPHLARPTLPTRAMLTVLGENPKVEVAIISGRERDSLAELLAGLPVHLIAEHGTFYRLEKQQEWQPLRRDLDLSWKDAVHEVMEDYASRVRGVIVEDKESALAWHYRLVEPVFGEWLARELGQHLVQTFAQAPLEVHLGKKVVEVRPQGIDKGRAAATLIEKLGPFDFILAAGDDRTDEDLFASLPSSAYAIKVGSGPSRARYRIESPARLRDFLESLGRRRV